MSSPDAVLQPLAEKEMSAAVKNAWQEQIKSHPTTAVVLFNAANSLMVVDFETALDLTEKAHRLDASNKEISLRLGQLYGLLLQYAQPQQKIQIAQKAFHLREDALRGVSDEERFTQLTDIASAALEAGDEAAAQKYAEEALTVAAQQKASWNYGNAIHQGNLVIGRIALRHGDLEEAKARLLKAGNTPGHLSSTLSGRI